MASPSRNPLHYAPILLGAAFIATLFIVAESGYQRIHDAGKVITAAEERQALMSRYLRLMLDAETAQRGFLLTENPRYLRNFDPAVRALDPLQALMSRYLRLMLDAETAQRGFPLTENPRYLRNFDPAVRALDPLLNRIVVELRESGLHEDAEKAQELRTLSGKKIGEMQTALRLYGEVNRNAALQMMDTDIGQRAMTDLRHQLRELYDAESERLAVARESSERDLQTSRVLLGAASFLSLVLVVLVGALLAVDIRRREKATELLDARNRELDRTVQQRTAMLFHLSSSLQKVAEREKAALARDRKSV